MSFLSFLSGLSPFKPRSLTGNTPSLLQRPAWAPKRQPGPISEPENRPGSPLTANLPEITQEQEAAVFARDAVDAYLHFGQWLSVQSSNVDALQYHPEESKLIIRFKDKGSGPGFYSYDNVSIREAEDIARSASKGGWVWDRLRIRGTVFGFKKSYQFLSGASSYQPKWMRSPQARAAHGQVGPEGERSAKQKSFLLGKPAFLTGKKGKP